jgi:hypothetical protein
MSNDAHLTERDMANLALHTVRSNNTGALMLMLSQFTIAQSHAGTLGDKHPAVTLLVSRLHELCGLGESEDTPLVDAHDACAELAGRRAYSTFGRSERGN